MISRMPRADADVWSEQYTWSNGRASDTAETIHLPERMSAADTESDPDQMPGLTNPFDDDAAETSSEPCWICRSCGSPDWRWMNSGYRCARCGETSFVKLSDVPFPPNQTGGGKWVYVPDHLGPPDSRRSAGEQRDFGTSVVGRRASKHGEPYDPGNSDFDGEHAESETLTHDASVDPDTMKPLSRRQRKAKKRDEAQQVPTRLPMTRPSTSSSSSDQKKVSKWRDDMLAGLNDVVGKKKDGDWTVQKGPAPGVKYRGGTPPSPPMWNYARDDLRAFQKWQRKVEIWQLQVSSYLPPNEAAMLLYVSLRGEAEEELEWCELSKINQSNGVQYIVDTLKQPLMTRSIYLKRKYLHEYEYVQRSNGETIRSFCNRYSRIERSLHSVGISVDGMYDSESRGARLLDRFRLNLDQQRLILVASGQSLEFDVIREAAQIQFPDHRPTPPVMYSKEFEGRQDGQQPRQQQPGYNGGKGGGKPQNFDRNRNSKGGGRGGGKSFHQQRTAHTTYVAETIDEEQEPEIVDDEAPDETYEEEEGDALAETVDDEQAEDGAEDDSSFANDIAEVAKCLTVTARRLQGLTLGRKFSGPPKSIQQRKAESHCSACGEKGHWAGDRECSQSATTNSSSGKGGGKTGSKNSSKTKPSDGGKGNAKKVMTVSQPGGYQREVTFNDAHVDYENIPHEEVYGTAFTTLMVNSIPYEISTGVHKVYGSNMHSLNHHLVLDTACQRTCCSKTWFDEWKNYVSSFHLAAQVDVQKEPFEFGHGPLQYSTHHALLPCCFNNETPCLIGTFIIPTTNDIPLLGSKHLLGKELGAVIDLPKSQARLTRLGVTVPIVEVNGHLALDIGVFPLEVHKLDVWKSFTNMIANGDFQKLEFAADEKTAESYQLESNRDCDNQREISETYATSTSMASRMASPREDLHGCRDDPLPGDVASLQDEDPKQKVAGIPRSLGDGRDDGALGEKARTVHSHQCEEVRQSPRQLQPMHRLRQEVAMGSRASGVARSKASIAKTAAAAALSVLFNGCLLQGPEVQTSLGHGSSNGFVDSKGRYVNGLAFDNFIEDFVGGQEGEDSSYSQTKEKPKYQEKEPRGGGGDLRLLRVGPDRPEPTEKLKSGTQKWLMGELKRGEKIYEKEQKVYEAMVTHQSRLLNGPHADVLSIDLLEIFAGRGRVSELAPRYGLRAVQPMDLKFGQDLKDEQTKSQIRQTVKKLKPLLLLVAWPCTVWNLFSENLNYYHRMDELHQLRAEDRPLVEFGVELCQMQLAEDRFFLGENPVRSRLWQEQSVHELRQHPDCRQVECHAGAYGAEASDGSLIVKPHRWLTNSQSIASRLQEKLTCDQKMFATPIEGKETRRSGEYCDGLASAILDGLREEAAVQDPSRFKRSKSASTVCFVGVIKDLPTWTTILKDAEGRFENTHKRPFTLSESDPMMNDIKKLVPWEIVRVQVTWLPQARRWPVDIPFTHRASILMNSQEQVLVEEEDLSSVNYPKQRFTHAVRVGIFVFGNAPDDEDEVELREGPPDVEKETFRSLGTEIWFEGVKIPRQLQHSIARLHCNLGHPPKAEIVRILAAAGTLNATVMTALDGLRCGSCQRLSKPTKPPTSSTSVVTNNGFFGDHLQTDIIFVRILTGEAVPVLGICCVNTNFHAAGVIANRYPETILEKLKEIWYRPFGLPLSITPDADTAYLGACQDWHVRMGIDYRVIPTEEAWKLGKIGRRNALVRTLAERLVDQHGIGSRPQLDDILVAVLYSINSSTYSYGRSPYQAVFGRLPRPVGDLISDHHALSMTNLDHDPALRPELLRAEAVTALMQISSSQAVRRALLRKTRNKTDLSQLQPGQTVAYWRSQGRSRQHKKGSWCLGRFLAFDPDKKSCWLQVGKTSVRVSVSQLRTATGWENWTPSKEDIQLLRDAQKSVAQGLWMDETGQHPTEEEAMNVDQELFDFRPHKAARHEADIDLIDDEETPYLELPHQLPPSVPQQLHQQPETPVLEPYNLATLPPPAAQRQELNFPAQLQQVVQQQQQFQNIQQTTAQHTQSIHQHDNRQITINVDSPTYQAYGDNVSFGPVPIVARHRKAPYTPTQQPQTPRANMLESEQRPAILAGQPSTPRPIEPALPLPIQDAQATSSTTPQPPSVPPTTFSTMFRVYDDGAATLRKPSWDGSEDFTDPFHNHKTAYMCYLSSNVRKEEMKGITDPDFPDADTSDDENLEISNDRTLTRQEAKQLDREIPWREIMTMPVMSQDAFIQSCTKEYEGWMKWTSVKPLTQKEADEVMADSTLRRRVLKSRAAYRDKARGIGKIRAKCRVVLIGCNDPDLRQLTRDSPTPSRLSEFVVLSVASAGANCVFNNDNKRWFLWLSDAEKAFLQGMQDKSERNGPLYMSPPKDPLIEASGSFPAPLYEVTGNCYGLPNAPRVWYRRVLQAVQDAGFMVHSFDRCCFYHVGTDNKIDCVMIVHVDDFMAAYSESFEISLLEKMFEWGSITKVDENHPGEYRGKEITMKRTADGKIHYKVSQKSFLKNLADGKLVSGRLKKEPKLNAEELKEFRSVCGCLQWLGGQSRPELASTASLCHRGNETDITDLQKLHEALKYAKLHDDDGIVFMDVPFNKASCLVTFADSSWANAANFSSQYGVVVALCPPQVTEKLAPALILDWKSGRSPRVCRSTLAAEAIAADEGTDRQCYINCYLTELLYLKPAWKGNMALAAAQCTDSKSLYDCLISENPSLTDRRSMVQIRSVQQALRPSQIRWIPTHLTVADSLTKIDVNLRDAFRKWCLKPTVRLREDTTKGKTKTSEKPAPLSGLL